MTDYLIDLISKNRNDQRLVKQFRIDEDLELNDEISDLLETSNDTAISPCSGIYHRYPSKLLLFPTSECLGHCRFCFRKNIKGENDHLSEDNFLQALRYIESSNVNEVIFSGGDPFAVGEETLISMLQKVRSISSVSVIRIHTRVLTYQPKLITDDFINELVKMQPLYMLFHINSHLELSDIAIERVKSLVNKGIMCFSQSALLKDVNDSEENLKLLFENLIINRIKPYYLFHPDRVMGSGHFYVSLKKGIHLYNYLYNRISGLAMPIYLFNIPGGYGHCIIDLGNVRELSNNKYEITNWQGEKVVYEDTES